MGTDVTDKQESVFTSVLSVKSVVNRGPQLGWNGAILVKIILRMVTALGVGICLIAFVSTARAQVAEAEQWGVYEILLHGSAAGNPFTDVSIEATFSHE